MAFQIADLYATIRADSTRFDRTVDTTKVSCVQLQGQMDKLGIMSEKRMQQMSVAADRMARYARIAFAAITGVAALSIREFMSQQKAEEMLDSALRNTGQSLEEFGPKLRAASEELQRLTVYADDVTLGLMAQSINLGATGNQIEIYTREAIGLATALKMDVGTALRYITLAHQGEFTMLRRYIPALRQTEDATEQLTIITRLAASGFSQAQAETKTLAGRIAQLKNEISDTAEAIGASLAPSLETALELVRDTITPVRELAIEYKNLAAAIQLVTLALVAGVSAGKIGAIAKGLGKALVSAPGLIAAFATSQALMVYGARKHKQAFQAPYPRAAEPVVPGATLEEIDAQVEATKRLLKWNEELADSSKSKRGRMQWGVEAAGFRSDLFALYEKRIELLKETGEVAEASEKEQLDLFEEHLKALENWDTVATDIERSRMTAHEREMVEMQETVDGMRKTAEAAGKWEQERTNILTYALDQREAIKAKYLQKDIDAINERFRQMADVRAELESEAESRARARVGAQRGASAFSSIAGVAQQIQEAIFKKGEEAQQVAELKKQTLIAKDQLSAERTIRDLMQKNMLIPIPFLTWGS